MQPNVLTIAGSDSGGGAGIQADIKTMTVLNTYAMSVITALTAQNGIGVQGIFAPEPDFVALQLKSVLDCFTIKAAKTGMLFSKNIVEVVSKALVNKDFFLVVDPVCVSQSGHKLLEESASDALKTKILPLADLLTPNLPEAEFLSGITINAEQDIYNAGQKLLELGAKNVLIKGGHSQVRSDFLVDYFFTSKDIIKLEQKFVDTKNNHGTGCTLSAAIVSYYALGNDLLSSIKLAQKYLNLALQKSYAPGCGIGPVKHFAILDKRDA